MNINTFCHNSGYLLSNIASKTFSRSNDITNNPSIAFPKSINDDLTVDNNLLNLINSYYNTVFIDSSYTTGCNLFAFSVSKFAGNFYNIAYIFSFIIYSALFPPPAVVLGNIDNIVSLLKNCY